MSLSDGEQCDYATGLSRSMSGRVLPSERPEHVIYESGLHDTSWFLRIHWADGHVQFLTLLALLAYSPPSTSQ